MKKICRTRPLMFVKIRAEIGYNFLKPRYLI